MFKKARRIAFAVLIGLLTLNMLGVRPYGTSGEWICMAGACLIGHAQADSITMTTDGGTIAIDGDLTAAPTDGLDLGWTIVAGANVACNTTCTYACVLGFELGAWDATSLLACTDATADTCLCAGGS